MEGCYGKTGIVVSSPDAEEYKELFSQVRQGLPLTEHPWDCGDRSGVNRLPRKFFTGNRIQNKGSSRLALPQRKNFFALVIGINDYVHGPLQGAVADAEAIRDYLIRRLHVPEDNIKVLLNRRATRDKIIQGFIALKDDARIKLGDPILIFFAGHGIEANSPKGWECGDPDNKIQMIMPYDFGKKQGRSTVYAIPDITIRGLIEGIAREKGNNITVIFDCCHSGSGTRGHVGEDDSSSLIRSVDIDVQVPLDLDQLLWSDQNARGGAFSRYSSARGVKSHILLSACGRKESARENGGRGCFTKALLALLEDVGPESLTYTSVLERMGPISRRILFNLRPSPATLNQVKISKKNGNYILEAGAIHGVTVGDEYAIYPNSRLSPKLGVIIVGGVETIKHSTTVLYPQQDLRMALTNSSVAVKSRVGKKFPLIFRRPSHSKLALYEELWKKLEKEKHSGICLHNNGTGAKLAISIINKDQIVFDVLDPEVRMDRNGVTRLTHTVSSSDKLLKVLHAAAHYYRYLEYEGTTRGIDDYISHLYRRLNHHGIVDITVGEHKRYGFKIVNRSPRDLYMNAFYFDNMDFSIRSWYQYHTAGSSATVDPTLQKEAKSHHSMTTGEKARKMNPMPLRLRVVSFSKLYNVAIAHTSPADPSVNTPADLNEALEVNGYDFESAMAWLVDKSLPQQQLLQSQQPQPPQPPQQQQPPQMPAPRAQSMEGRVVVVPREAVFGMRERGFVPGPADPGRGGPRYGARPVQGANRICRYFLAGECMRADCRFSHDLERALCRFWLRGNCAKQENCTRIDSRDGLPASTPPPDEFPTLASAGRGRGYAPRYHDPSRNRFAAAVKAQPNPMIPTRFGSPQRREFNRSNSNGVPVPRPSPRIKLRSPTLLPTLPTGESVNKLYMSYRQRALQLGAARNACLSRAADAWRRGDGAAAKRFSREGHELNAKMGGEAAEAAGRVVKERVRLAAEAVRGRDLGWSDEARDRSERGRVIGAGLGVVLGVASRDVGAESGGVKMSPKERMEALLDLHWLHANEAVEVLERFLVSLEKEAFFGLVYIVVGEEKHTGSQDPARGSSRARLAAGVREWLHDWGYPWSERDGVICVDPLTHA
ncbi:hypothetical protein M422DRAFT_774468 [Sphaerobolus stellatus SS14]|nr:hypothetical protein M422DRAFT_774468 [Sphaerobolus stellatus SS14]